MKRREILNLKNLQCQAEFKRATNQSHDLRECMKLMQPLSEKVKVWKTALNSHLGRSFRTVRVRKKLSKISAADSLVDERAKLTKIYEKESSKVLKEDITRKIDILENKIF